MFLINQSRLFVALRPGHWQGGLFDEGSTEHSTELKCLFIPTFPSELDQSHPCFLFFWPASFEPIPTDFSSLLWGTNGAKILKFNVKSRCAFIENNNMLFSTLNTLAAVGLDFLLKCRVKNIGQWWKFWEPCGNRVSRLIYRCFGC